MKCSLCNTKIQDCKIMFRDECDHCGGDLHICLNCSFYDPHVSNQCLETMIPEPVKDKDRKNLCDYFKAREGSSEQSAKPGDDAIREKLEGLFK